MIKHPTPQKHYLKFVLYSTLWNIKIYIFVYSKYIFSLYIFKLEKSFLSLFFINLTCSAWIKVLISLKKNKFIHPKFFNSSVYCYKRFLFLINAVLVNFFFIKESWKKHHRFKNTMISTTLFNIVNKWFPKYQASLKTGVMADENSALHRRN